MKKYKIAVTTMLVCFALSTAGCLLSFAYMSLRDLSWQSSLDKQAAFKLQEKEFQKLSEEHRAWKKLPDELQQFRREHIINLDDFAVFRRELNSCLAANQLKVTKISSQFSRSQGKTRKVTIGFALEGAYRDLKKFIFDMEKMPKMHFFERVELNGSAEMVKGNFKMEAYIAE
jgi:Tfp pilus assembly protein PilO